MAFQDVTGRFSLDSLSIRPPAPLATAFLGATPLSLWNIWLGAGGSSTVFYQMTHTLVSVDSSDRPSSQWINGGALEYEVGSRTVRLQHAGAQRYSEGNRYMNVLANLTRDISNADFPSDSNSFTMRLHDGAIEYRDVSAEFRAEAGVSMSARPIAGAYVQPTFTALGGVSMDARVTGPPTPRPIFNIPLDVRMDVGINTKDVAASFRADVTARMSVNIQHDKSVAASFSAPIEARMAAVVSHDKTARPGVFSVPIDTRFDVNVEGTKSIRPTFTALDGVSIEAGVRADRHVRAEFVALDGVRIAVRIPRQYVDTPGFYRLDADTGMRFDTHKIYDGDALTQALYDRMAVPLGYRTTRPGYGAGPFEATPHPDDAAISLRAALLSDPQVSAVSHQVFYEPSGARIDFAVTADVGGEPTELALSVNL